MSRLNNRLTLWEQNRLIAPEQKQLILDFESQNKTSHLPYAVFMLGVFVTALGIISLIAANWEEIGGGVKLTADFILLAVLAGGIMRAQNRGSAFWRETGIFALFMMTGASIGLIAQVFQTNGTLANGALTWALFSAPLLAVSGKKALPLFWVPVFFYGLCFRPAFWKFAENVILFIHDHISAEPAVAGALLIIFYGLGAYAFYRLNLLFKRKYPVFAVCRGYFEFFAYCSAFFLLVGDFFFTSSLTVSGMAAAIAAYAAAAWIYYRHNSPKMTNFNIAMIGVSFFVAYLRLFGDLLTTGVGLVISGALIMALVLVTKAITDKTANIRGENR